MFKWSHIVGAFAVASAMVLGVYACKQTLPSEHPLLGSLASSSSNVSYSMNGGTTFNVANAAYPTGLPPNGSVAFQLQSPTGVFQVTYTWTCPGFFTNPQSFQIRNLDGGIAATGTTNTTGNWSTITVPTPNMVPSYCTLNTQTYDGVSSYSNSVNQFQIGAFGVIEIPVSAQGTVLNAYSASTLPNGAVVTGNYFAIGTTWDAGCNINVYLDGGAYVAGWDSGNTIAANGTLTTARERVYNEGGAQPLSVALLAACEAGVGTGTIGIEYAIPGN